MTQETNNVNSPRQSWERKRSKRSLEFVLLAIHSQTSDLTNFSKITNTSIWSLLHTNLRMHNVVEWRQAWGRKRTEREHLTMMFCICDSWWSITKMPLAIVVSFFTSSIFDSANFYLSFLSLLPFFLDFPGCPSFVCSLALSLQHTSSQCLRLFIPLFFQSLNHSLGRFFHLFAHCIVVHLVILFNLCYCLEIYQRTIWRLYPRRFCGIRVN